MASRVFAGAISAGGKCLLRGDFNHHGGQHEYIFIIISKLIIFYSQFIGTYATELFVSPLNPYSTVTILVFVLCVTSIKEGSEDFQRSRSDKFENNRKVTVVTFNDGQIVETEKENHKLKAGDIVKMVGTTSVPADMIIILTSMYADGNQCFVETANIDGETNLKLKEAPSGLASIISSGKASPQMFSGSISFEQPNKNIHNFVGTLALNSLADPVPLSVDNLLLRSSLFSNTDWAYGVVVYTGQETKIQMNNRHASSKMSRLEVYLNQAIMIIFFAQVTLVTISVGSIYMRGFDDKSTLPYVFPGGGSTSILPLFIEQWCRENAH